MSTPKGNYAGQSPDHFRRRLLHCTKARAKILSIPFSLTLDTVDWLTHCPVLGLKLRYQPSPKGKRAYELATLDRMVPQLGYVPGNVFVISHKANYLKSNGTLVDHQAIVRYMEARQKEGVPCSFTPILTP